MGGIPWRSSGYEGLRIHGLSAPSLLHSPWTSMTESQDIASRHCAELLTEFSLTFDFPVPRTDVEKGGLARLDSLPWQEEPLPLNSDR